MMRAFTFARMSEPNLIDLLMTHQMMRHPDEAGWTWRMSLKPD